MKNFRKTLAHLWADVQACFCVVCKFSLSSFLFPLSIVKMVPNQLWINDMGGEVLGQY